MTKQLIEKTNLALKIEPKLELVLYTSHSWLFLRLYKDIKVVIEGPKVKHPIFVIKIRDHNLL